MKKQILQVELDGDSLTDLLMTLLVVQHYSKVLLLAY